MKAGFWWLTVILLALGFCLGAAKVSQACCVYNKAKSPIHVSFGCGFLCGNEWDIKKGHDKCRPGKSGVVTVTVRKKNGKDYASTDYCRVKVDAHGWVSVTQSGKTVTVKSKHEDGSKRSKCRIHNVEN